MYVCVCVYVYELPRWLSGEESACQCKILGRCRFSPWVRKIPWRRKWQATPVFLPGESHEQRSLVDYSQRVTKSWTWLSTRACRRTHAHTHTQTYIYTYMSEWGYIHWSSWGRYFWYPHCTNRKLRHRALRLLSKLVSRGARIHIQELQPKSPCS